MATHEERAWAARRRLLHGVSTESLAETFGVKNQTIAQWVDAHLDLLQSEHTASVGDFLAFQRHRRTSVRLSEGTINHLLNRSIPTQFITNLESWNGYLSAVIAAPAMPAQNQLEIAAQIVHRDEPPKALLTEGTLQRFRLEVPPNVLPYFVTVNNPLNPRDTQTGLRARDVVEYYDWNDVIQGQELPAPPTLTPLPVEVDDQGSGSAAAVVDALEYVLRRQGAHLRGASHDAVGKPVISWGQWPSVSGRTGELNQLQEKAKSGEPILRKPQLAVRWDVGDRLLADELVSAFSTVWSAYSSVPSVVVNPNEPNSAMLGYWPDPFVAEALKRSLRAVFGLTTESDRQPLAASAPLPPEQLSRLAASAGVIQTVCSRIFALADGQKRTLAEAVNANLANDIEIKEYLKTYSEPLETARTLTKNEITETMRDLRERRRRIEEAQAVLGGRKVANVAHASQPAPGEPAFELANVAAPSGEVEGTNVAEPEPGRTEGPTL